MKAFFIILLAGCMATACNQNDAANSGSATNAVKDSANFTSLQWVDSTFQNLGKVKEGQTVLVSWRFRNTGSKPLIVSNATASCGCTVAEKPEQPVAPGEEGTIKAKFDSNGRQGPQNKEVYVTANTKGTTNHELSFRVEVEKNNSI